MKLKEILKITWLPVLAASLCCVSPLVLFLLGLSTAAFTATLADTLYFEYGWWFRGMGVFLLILSFALYYRKKGVCTLSQAKKRRNEILNTFLLTLVAAAVFYVVFLGFIVEYIGVWLGAWDSYWANVFSEKT